jgi:hypothetical protein
MSIAVASEQLLTAEEFGRRPDPGYPEELVRGRIVGENAPRVLNADELLEFPTILPGFSARVDEFFS